MLRLSEVSSDSSNVEICFIVFPRKICARSLWPNGDLSG